MTKEAGASFFAGREGCAKASAGRRWSRGRAERAELAEGDGEVVQALQRGRVLRPRLLSEDRQRLLPQRGRLGEVA